MNIHKGYDDHFSKLVLNCRIIYLIDITAVIFTFVAAVKEVLGTI